MRRNGAPLFNYTWSRRSGPAGSEAALYEAQDRSLERRVRQAQGQIWQSQRLIGRREVRGRDSSNPGDGRPLRPISAQFRPAAGIECSSRKTEARAGGVSSGGADSARCGSVDLGGVAIPGDPGGKKLSGRATRARSRVWEWVSTSNPPQSTSFVNLATAPALFPL